MKRIGLILIAVLLMAFPLFSQNVNIPDAAFLDALIEEGVDTNGDKLIDIEEAEARLCNHKEDNQALKQLEQSKEQELELKNRNRIGYKRKIEQ